MATDDFTNFILVASLLPIKETFAAETDPVYDKIIQKEN